MNALKTISITLLFISIIFNASAKKKPYHEELNEIKNLFEKLKQSNNDNKLNAINDEIIINLLEFLESPKSLNVSFDSLQNYMSILESDDNLLKVFTWNIQYSDKSFKYFGFLQHLNKKQKNKIDVYFLNDKKYKPLDDLDDDDFDRKYKTNTEWYGALYYELITKKFNSKTYYTLIGWDGADLFINRKIIEVLQFDKYGLPSFGNKMFKLKKNVTDRLIFEYAEMVSMHLRYNPKHDIIVMDHLSPPEERYQGMYQFYGPDRSFDALRFMGNKWVLENNIDPNIAINYKRNPHIEKLMKRDISKGF